MPRCARVCMCVPWRLHHQRALCITSRACQAREGRCIHVMWSSKCMMAWLMACAHDIELKIAPADHSREQPTNHATCTHIVYGGQSLHPKTHLCESISRDMCMVVGQVNARSHGAPHSRPSKQGRVQCSDLAERVQKKLHANVRQGSTEFTLPRTRTHLCQRVVEW